MLGRCVGACRPGFLRRGRTLLATPRAFRHRDGVFRGRGRLFTGDDECSRAQSHFSRPRAKYSRCGGDFTEREGHFTGGADSSSARRTVHAGDVSSRAAQRDQCNFWWAVNPHGHVHRANSPTHEHRRVIACGHAGDDGKFLRGDRADKRQHHLAAVCVA